MIGLLVADLLLLRRTPWLRPPVGGLFVLASIRVIRLLLWLDDLHPGFSDEFASRLLAVLETLLVEVPHILVVADSEIPRWVCL